MNATSEVLWRCRECGKWSHAKRRPLRHKRYGGTEFDLTAEQERFVAETTTAREHDTGAYFDVVWLWCGPFDRYEARHSDSSSPPALDPEKLPEPKDNAEPSDSSEAAALNEVPF